jgi:hypothetical protein
MGDDMQAVIERVRVAYGVWVQHVAEHIVDSYVDEDNELTIGDDELRDVVLSDFWTDRFDSAGDNALIGMFIDEASTSDDVWETLARDIRERITARLVQEDDDA